MEKMIPIDLLEEFSWKYPKAFKMIDRIFCDKDTKWHKEYCYCPVGLAMEYVKAYGTPALDDSLWAAKDGGRMAVLSSWRYAKSVYRISEGLTHEFLKKCR